MPGKHSANCTVSPALFCNSLLEELARWLKKVKILARQVWPPEFDPWNPLETLKERMNSTKFFSLLDLHTCAMAGPNAHLYTHIGIHTHTHSLSVCLFKN